MELEVDRTGQIRIRRSDLAWVPDDARPIDPGEIVQQTLGKFTSLAPALVLGLLASVPASYTVKFPRPAFSDLDFAEVLKQLPPSGLAALPPAVFEAITCLGFIESAAYVINATVGMKVPQLRLLARLSLPECSPRVSDRHAALLAYGGCSATYEFKTLACTDSLCETIAATARDVNSPCLVMSRSPMDNTDFVSWVDRTNPEFAHEWDQRLLATRHTLRTGTPEEVVNTVFRIHRSPDGEAEVLTLLRTDALTPLQRSLLLDAVARSQALDLWGAGRMQGDWPSGAASWNSPCAGLRTVALEPTIMARFEKRPVALPRLIQWLERNGITFDPNVLPESLKTDLVKRRCSVKGNPVLDQWLLEWLHG